LLRTVITALPSPSLASTVALILEFDENAAWNLDCPVLLFQSSAITSLTSVIPALLVLPAFSGVVLSLQIASLYPLAKSTALGSEFWPPSSSKTCGLVTFQSVTHCLKPVPMSSPTCTLSKLT